MSHLALVPELLCEAWSTATAVYELTVMPIYCPTRIIEDKASLLSEKSG